MKLSPHACAAATLLIAQALAPQAAHAQCLECAQQMFQATLTGNAWYSINQNMIDDTRDRDASSGTCYDANRRSKGCEGTRGRPEPGAPARVTDRTRDKAMYAVRDVLLLEYRQRERNLGRAAASQWLNTASGDIGRQVAALEPEYPRRFAAQDPGRAAAWYVDSARQIAERYVRQHQGPGLGEAMIGRVPAATRQRAEDATFAELEPEIRRHEREQGQASAMAWARELGLAVGSGVKNLAPEYAARAQQEGAASADAWYVDQARKLARGQIGASR